MRHQPVAERRLGRLEVEGRLMRGLRAGQVAGVVHPEGDEHTLAHEAPSLCSYLGTFATVKMRPARALRFVSSGRSLYSPLVKASSTSARADSSAFMA
ncbi:hypothetical protein ACFPRL_31970 [Pseudoclavibacter helvolus]